MNIDVPRFMSIREIAKTGLLSEYNLRLLEKQKKLPCVYVGRKCLVNFSAIEKRLLGIMERMVDLKPMPVPEIFEDETDD